MAGTGDPADTKGFPNHVTSWLGYRVGRRRMKGGDKVMALVFPSNCYM